MSDSELGKSLPRPESSVAAALETDEAIRRPGEPVSPPAALAQPGDEAPSDTPAAERRGWESVLTQHLSQAGPVQAELDAIQIFLGDSPVPPPGERLGRFEILRTLGIGGHGVVLLARESALERFVALKIPKFALATNSALKKRFILEGRTAAQLSHPNIVTVYEAGEIDGVPYFAQEYVPGPSLAVWLERHPEPVAPLVAAAIVMPLAEAAGLAHRHRILHRDIKPGNILLAPLPLSSAADRLEDCVPKLTDFGIAKVLEDSNQTATGGALGTPAYMSPEQATGRRGAVDPRSDVYSIGAVLYELLTHQRVVRGENDLESLHLLQQGKIVPPQRLRSLTPSDLNAVCMKCLSRDPADRYQTAQELADDLRRFLDGQPVTARPLPWVTSLGRWGRRNPLAASLAGILVCSLVVLLAGALWFNARLRNSLEIVEHREQELRQRTDELRKRAYADDLRNAAEAWQLGNANEARKRLEACVPQPGETDLRSFPWWMLSRKIAQTSRMIGKISPGATAAPLVMSANGDVAYCGEPDGVICVRSVPSGLLLFELRGHAVGEIFALDLHEQAGVTRLASAGGDGTVRVWEPGQSEAVLVIPAHEGHAMTVRFLGPNAEALGTGGADHMIRIWETASGRRLSELAGHTDSVRALVEQTRTGILFSSAEDDTIRAWDWKQALPAESFERGRLAVPKQAGWARNLALEPSQDGLTAGFRTGRVIIWDVREKHRSRGEITFDVQLASGVRALTWCGELTLAIGCADSRIFLVRNSSSEKVAREILPGHDDWVLSLADGGDDRGLLSSSRDGSLRWWPAAEWNGPLRLSDEATRFACPGVWNRSVYFAALPQRGVAVHLADGSPAFRVDLPYAPEGVWATAAPDGGRVFTSETEDRINYRFVAINPTNGQTEWSLPLGTRPAALGSAMSPDGRLLALSLNHDVCCVDAQTGERLATMVHPRAATQLAFDGAVRELYSGCLDGRIRVWNPRTGALVREWQAHTNSAQHVCLSEDDGLLATSGEDLRVRVWQLPDAKEIAAFVVSAELKDLFLVEGGKTLIAHLNHRLRFWDVPTQMELMKWDALPPTTTVCLNPDRTTLALQFCGRRVALLHGTPETPSDCAAAER